MLTALAPVTAGQTSRVAVVVPSGAVVLFAVPVIPATIDANVCHGATPTVDCNATFVRASSGESVTHWP